MKIEMPTYTIEIQKNGLSELGQKIASFYQGKDIFVVSDETVYHLYQEKLHQALDQYQVHTVIVKPGEPSKSFETYQRVIASLIAKGIKRNHLLIAFGGGVVGDLAGFVAATLYRGINYMQVPTTLLAQVDSSIGGKVGIDLTEGKNLVGSFYNPKYVLIDPELLKTLEKLEYANGIAEMIKCGLIGDPKLYQALKQQKLVDVEEIQQAIEVKRKVVLIDPFDQKERMFLNFGHTYGHAIEKAHGYQTYKHGQAISYGMLIALEKGIEWNETPKYLYEEVKDLLIQYGLIHQPLLNAKDYEAYLKTDKKQISTGLKFVIINDIGHPKTVLLKENRT